MNAYDFGKDPNGREAYEKRHYEYEAWARKIAGTGKVKLLNVEYGKNIAGNRDVVTIEIPGCEGHPKNFWLEYAEDTDTYRNLQGATPISTVNVSFHKFGGKTETGFEPATGIAEFLTFSKTE